MGKKKSMVFTVLLSIVLAALLAVSVVSCTVPFTNGVKEFNSLLSNIQLGEETNGGSFAVLYPEGVISAAEYADITDEDDKNEYEAYGDGSIYVEVGLLTDEFKADFNEAVEVLTYRMEAKELSSASVTVENDYTIRVTVSGKDTSASSIATIMAYSGDLSFVYGSKTYFKNTYNNDIKDYIKSAKSLVKSGVYCVQINLTKLGREKLAEATEAAAASDDDNSVYFKIGDETVTSLGVDETIDENVLLISGYETKETADSVAILIQSCVEEKNINLEFTAGDVCVYEYANGEQVAVLLAVVVALIIVASVVAVSVAFKGLGLVHAYTLLTYALLTVCVIAGMSWELTFGALAVAVFGGLLVSALNVYVFKTMNEEFAKGRTIEASVKHTYKKTVLPVVDLHAVLLVAALAYLWIASAAMSAMATVAVLVVVLSFVSFWITRFYWYMMLPLAKDRYRFCNVHRQEVADEE